jgi:molecular chaperone GrpE
VIKDKRKIEMSGQAKSETEQSTGATPSDAVAPPMGQPAKPAEAEAKPETTADAADGAPASSAAADAAQDEGEVVETKAPAGFAAELESMRSELDERLRDLQRVTAEYANYRKRVERDRGVMAEQTVAMVVTSLLPILDDFDRARDHGDLTGQLATVAEQLNTILAKLGLSGFGEQGDVFDPTRHEAVAHQTSAEVTEPTCIGIMRRGYLLGDRLLRPALVAVADPE